MAYLILVRHCMSSYNAKGLWTGWDDPSLTDEGRQQAKLAAKALENISIDIAFSPPQKRSIETLQEILAVLQKNAQIIQDRAIMERNYGDFTAKNKWEVKKQLGETEFLRLRRGWDYPIPNGESLKQVYDRLIPFYQNQILPKLMEGKNIILVSSGNALRALVKFLDNIPDGQISQFEIAVGEILIYTVDENGNVVQREKRNSQNPVP